MTKANRVFSTPRRTASKTKPKLNVVEDKIDYKAVLARAEHVVALLRTCQSARVGRWMRKEQLDH